MAALSYNQDNHSTIAGTSLPYGFHLPNEQINSPNETFDIGWTFGRNKNVSESDFPIQKQVEEVCHAIQVPDEDMPIYWRPV